MHLPWGTLPAHFRVGESYDDTITLYRGDKKDRVSPELGIMSTAAAAGHTGSFEAFQDACSAGDESLIRMLVNQHVGYAHRDGTPTPFVSASPRKSFAERMAQGDDEEVVEIEVPVHRLIAHRSDGTRGALPDEILVFEAVEPEEIRAIHTDYDRNRDRSDQRRELDIPIGQLMPIQARGVSLPHVRSLNYVDKLPPVEVVAYDGEPGEKDTSYLLTNGTHTAYGKYLSGHETVRAHVIETDDEVAAGIALAGCKDVQDVRNKYDTLWRPLIEAFGIEGVGSLPVRHDGRYDRK